MSKWTDEEGCTCAFIMGLEVGLGEQNFQFRVVDQTGLRDYTNLYEEDFP